MDTRAPYAQNQRSVPSTEWVDLLSLHQAWHITQLALRVSGAGIDGRVLLRGRAGEEEIASGSIAATTTAPVRVSPVPEVLAGALVVVQARLTASGSAVTTSVEAAWVPAIPGRLPLDG